MPTGIALSNEVKLKIINTYTSKIMTISECAKQLGLSNPTVIKVLNEFNIKRYSKNKIYSPLLNEDYFEQIDDEHKAYWLGFLITDGNIFIPTNNKQKEKTVSISQKNNRSYILEQFKKDVGSSTVITQDGRGTGTLFIRSTKMANDLSQYGIESNKTLSTYLPSINNCLESHLIRGILDGDGSITSLMLKSGKHKHAISFCGTHILMENIVNCISSNIEVSKPKVYDYSDKHLSEVKWQSIADCEAIGKWLYKDATVYLKDKKEKFKQFLNHYNL